MQHNHAVYCLQKKVDHTPAAKPQELAGDGTWFLKHTEDDGIFVMFQNQCLKTTNGELLGKVISVSAPKQGPKGSLNNNSVMVCFDNGSYIFIFLSFNKKIEFTFVEIFIK